MCQNMSKIGVNLFSGQSYVYTYYINVYIHTYTPSKDQYILRPYPTFTAEYFSAFDDLCSQQPSLNWNIFNTDSNSVPIETFSKYGRISLLWVINPLKRQ